MTEAEAPAAGEGQTAPAVRVFISYAHESDEHAAAVRELWVLLRALGIDAKLDLPAAEHRQDWSLWMAEQVRLAGHVLCIASPAYRRRAEGRAAVDEGRGVQWEARLIRDSAYADMSQLDRFLPVLLPGASVEDVPDFLAPHTSTVYRVSSYTLAGIEPLYRLLTGQARVEEPPLGTVVTLDSPTAVPTVALPPLHHGVQVEVELVGNQLNSRTLLAGTELGSMTAPLPAEVPHIWEQLANHRDGAAVRSRLVAAGRLLSLAMFDPTTMRHLTALVNESPIGTVLDLSIVGGDSAMNLPYELITTTADGRPFVLLPGVRLTRRHVEVQRTATDPLPGPLKILAAVAAPDESRTNNQPLDVEAEMQAILDATGDLDGETAQVRILEVASLEQITEALKADQFHVLHLSAHGNPSGVELEDEEGNPVWVRTEQLVDAVRAGEHPLPLIVLSSCASAGDSTGLATTLVRRGADRVIGMQAPVTDHYATSLVQGLYRTLADDPHATIGKALAEARRQVDAAQLTAARIGEPVGLIQYPVPTLLAAGEDPPLRQVGTAPIPLHRRTIPPSGRGVRELPIGQLIGRRQELRTAVRGLRGNKADRSKVGDCAGVVLTGVGGIGKSAVAGRLVARMREQGWLIAEHDGRWNPTALVTSVATALSTRADTQELAQLMYSTETDDIGKLAVIRSLLGQTRLILVFDDFEQNLKAGGQAFADFGFAETFADLIDGTGVGRILVTCRYPVPDADDLLRIDLPPLSRAEQQRLFLRLPALQSLDGADRQLVQRMIGGHPRLMEFINVLIRTGTSAEFRHVSTKLRDLARTEQIDVRPQRDVSTAIAEAVRLGSRDILLEALLEQLDSSQRELALQAALFSAPFTTDDLAVAIHGVAAAPDFAATVAADAEMLVDRTLLSVARSDGELLMHPWIGQGLDDHQGEQRTERHRRGATMRLNRLNTGLGDFDDLVELIQHLAGSEQYNQAVGVANQACTMIGGQLTISALLGEVVPLIPVQHLGYLPLADRECLALELSGRLSATRNRRYALLGETARRAATDPHNSLFQRDLSVSHTKLGDLAMRTGDGPAATEHYQAALIIQQRLADADPGNAQAQRDLSVGHTKLGDLAIRTGDGPAATEHYQAALIIQQRLADADPGNAQAQRDLGVGHNRLGDLAIRTGDGPAATEHYHAAFTIQQRLADADPGNTEAQRDLSISHERVGDLAMRTGDGPAATEHYHAAFTIQQRLADADPGNTEAQRDLSVSHNKLGDLAMRTGDGPAATEHYHAALIIRQRLADADPDDTQAQRDLSVGHTKLGDLAIRTGDSPAATEHYQAALTIDARLADADPGNAQAQRDLSISHNKLGDLAMRTGDGPAATEHYHAALTIRQRLTTADPGNAQAQRDLSISHTKLGDLAIRTGDSPAATEHYQAALTIDARLADADPGNAQAQRDLSISHTNLGDLAIRTGDSPAATEHYHAALTIHQRLATADPGNTEAQRDLSISHTNLGDLATRTGDSPAATEHYHAALTIQQRLTTADPGNAQAQRDLSISHTNLGDLAIRTGDSPAATEHYHAALTIHQRLADADPSNADLKREIELLRERIDNEGGESEPDD